MKVSGATEAEEETDRVSGSPDAPEPTEPDPVDAATEDPPSAPSAEKAVSSERPDESDAGDEPPAGDAPPSKSPNQAASPSAARPRARLRTVIAVLVALALGTAGYLLWRSHRPDLLPPPAAKADLLDAVPTSPMLLATLDLDALRASRLGPLLRAQEGPGVLGRVRATCGFEPVDSIKEIALVVPASSDDADFGLIAVGELDQAGIVDCAQKVVASRGGKPISTALGSFRTVRDTSAASGEIAVRPGGPLLVGAGNYLRTMVDTTDGALPTVRTDRAHVALRAALTEGSLAKVTIVLSPRQRATIADEVARSGGHAPSALTGVLAAALGAKITPETVQLHAVILVESDASAKELVVAFEAFRKERADDRLLRLLGLAQLLDRIRVQAETTQIHLNLELTITEAEMLAEKLSALRGAEAEPRVPASAAPPLESGQVAPAPSAPPTEHSPTRASATPASSASGRPPPRHD